MNLLFFDTETTGLPKDFNAPITDTDNWPRLVQLAWILTDETGKELQRRNDIAKPEDFEIPAEVTAVHGITTHRAQVNGISLGWMLDHFEASAQISGALVAHNITFDLNIIGAELVRKGMFRPHEKTKTICTMNSGVELCKLTGRYGKYKRPRLAELHEFLFGENFDNAHNAMADTEAMKRCFFEMVKRGVIKI